MTDTPRYITDIPQARRATAAQQQRIEDHDRYYAQEWVDHAMRSTARPNEWLPRDCTTLENGYRRPQTMAESMAEMLDYGDFAQRAMDYLALAARKDHTARQLLDDMGRQWASLHAPEYEDD